ncbi:hypothetical protein EV426DRAFT_392856 [Tirmania nivea]|nr:hypothetical protein EV426DRAFT_392856 [Tirmania nivea]
MDIQSEGHPLAPPLPPAPQAASGDIAPAGTAFTGTPVTPVVERKLRPRPAPRIRPAPTKRSQPDTPAEGGPLGARPARKRASRIQRSGSVAPSPAFAAAAGGDGSELGQKGGVGLGAQRKRKMEATAAEGERVGKRNSLRLASESTGKNEDEAVTLRRKKAETKGLQDTGKETHSHVEDGGEDVVHIEQKAKHAQPMLPIAVRGKFCGLRPLMQKHVAGRVDPPVEDDSWSVQSDRGMDTEREIEDTENETATSERSLQDDGYILSWNEYTVDNILSDQNAQLDASSPSPSLYTTARRDSGVSLWRHCADPQLLNTAPHPALLLRGGETSTALTPPPAYPAEQRPFGLNDQYEERELYKNLDEELGKQAVDGIWDSVSQDTQGQEGQLKSGAVGAVKPALEAEYPVLHFALPSPFAGAARDEWHGGSEAEDGWSSPASNETVEIPQPGSGGVVWSGQEWPGWDERNSPVWVEQDWGKWAGSVRGPYGREGF